MTWSKSRILRLRYTYRGLAVLMIFLILAIATVYYIRQPTGPQVDGAGSYATGSGTSLTGSLTHSNNVVVVIFIWSNTGATIDSVTLHDFNTTRQGGLGISIGGISCWAIRVTWGMVTNDPMIVTFANGTTSAFVALSISNTNSFATEDPQFAIGHDSTSASVSATIPYGTPNRLILQSGIGSGSGSVSLPTANGVIARVTAEDTLTNPQVFMYAGTAGDGASYTYSNTVTASGSAFVGSMVIAVDP